MPNVYNPIMIASCVLRDISRRQPHAQVTFQLLEIGDLESQLDIATEIALRWSILSH